MAYRVVSCPIAVVVAAMVGCGGAATEPLPPEPTFQPEAGFDLLSLSDFTVFDSKPRVDSPNWREEGGRIECEGNPRGYLYLNESLENFTLRLDARYPKPDEAKEPGKPNTGVLLFVSGEHRVWPKCLEVQGRFDEMGQVKSNARDITVAATEDHAARETSRKPADEWNSLEIVVRDGAVTSRLNGTVIAESEPTELVAGPFALQSEGNAVHFRYIRLKRD